MTDRYNRFAAGCAIAAALLIGSLTPVRAQTSYGAIVGTVIDATRAAIPGASVTLGNIGTAERRTATTDAAGVHPSAPSRQDDRPAASAPTPNLGLGQLDASCLAI